MQQVWNQPAALSRRCYLWPIAPPRGSAAAKFLRRGCGRLTTAPSTPAAVPIALGDGGQAVKGVAANVAHKDAWHQRRAALLELITASTILPALIYGATVILYLAVRKRLEHKEGAFSLGRYELPVAIGAPWPGRPSCCSSWCRPPRRWCRW